MVSQIHSSLLGKALSRPGGVLAGTFACLILVGAVLLSLPLTHGNEGVSPLDALFTATSAVCVTGLIVVDTGQDYNLAGQMTILVLIQLGGLGIMTFAGLAAQVVGHRLSFRSQAALQDSFYQKNAAVRFRRHLKWIVVMTLAFEAIGAYLLFRQFSQKMPDAEAAYVSVFHAISAFCNAGFSTFSDSLTGIRKNIPAMTTISVLIVLGGLGYTVLFEVLQRSWRRLIRRPNKIVWTLHTRVVLITTLILIVTGAVAIDLFGLTDSETGIASRTGNALFQSITARTAGFNTVDIAALPVPSLLWLTTLMFIGGSPGSCAGGVKTTSVAIWFARLRARIRQRDDVTIGGRRIPVDLVRRTGLLLGTAAVFNLIGIMVLSITEMPGEGVGLDDIVFEQISAFATVGLSTGLTPDLSVIGKLWIIVSMFVGRLGPLTIMLAVLERKASTVRLAEERVMIG